MVFPFKNGPYYVGPSLMPVFINATRKNNADLGSIIRLMQIETLFTRRKFNELLNFFFTFTYTVIYKNY